MIADFAAGRFCWPDAGRRWRSAELRGEQVRAIREDFVTRRDRPVRPGDLVCGQQRTLALVDEWGDPTAAAGCDGDFTPSHQRAGWLLLPRTTPLLDAISRG